VPPGENAPHSGCGSHGGCVGAVNTVTARPSLPVTRSWPASWPHSVNDWPTATSSRTARFLAGAPSGPISCTTICADSPGDVGDWPSLMVSGVAVTLADNASSDG